MRLKISKRYIFHESIKISYRMYKKPEWLLSVLHNYSLHTFQIFNFTPFSDFPTEEENVLRSGLVKTFSVHNRDPKLISTTPVHKLSTDGLAFQKIDDYYFTFTFRERLQLTRLLISCKERMCSSTIKVVDNIQPPSCKSSRRMANVSERMYVFWNNWISKIESSQTLMWCRLLKDSFKCYSMLVAE